MSNLESPENVRIQSGVGTRTGLPSERRPAVPVASERFSFRTWGVSTACAGQSRFRAGGSAGTPLGNEARLAGSGGRAHRLAPR